MSASIGRITIAIVIVHAVIALVHGSAHQALPVSLSTLQSLFVFVVIAIGPLAGAILLGTGRIMRGNRIILGSMAGSLVFGLYYHFMEVGPDHVSQVPLDGWGQVFRISAALLLLSEGLGCWAAVWALNQMPRGERTAEPRSARA